MSTAESQILKCQCGAKLKVPAAAAGRKIRCPKCEFTMVVPQGSAVAEARMSALAGAASPASAAPAASDDGDLGGGLFDELASAESTATSTVAAPAGGANCPRCGRPMKAGASGCATCGYGTAQKAEASGVAGSTAAKAAVATASAAKQVASIGTRFAIGCVLSGVGALIGAVVWYFVARKTGFEVGYVAWGLGLAAGFGMIVGVRGHHPLAGIVAAAIAAGGILAAKYMIFSAALGGVNMEVAMRTVNLVEHRGQVECFERGLALISPECDAVYDRYSDQFEDMPESQLEREYAATQQWQTQRWADPKYVENFLMQEKAAAAYWEEEADSEDDELPFSKARWEKHRAAAAQEVAALSPEARVAEARRIAEEQEQNRQALMNALRQGVASEVGFFKTMFDPIDIVFVLLALGSAYKLASGGGEAE